MRTYYIRNQDEQEDQHEAYRFMTWGQTSDKLLGIKNHLLGIWLENTVLVTRIHPASSVGFGLKQGQRELCLPQLIWVNLDYETPIPSVAEVRFMASLKGIQA